MNTSSTSEPSQLIPAKSKFYLTFFLCLFLGVFGVHRFYTGKIKSGVVQLLTCGGLGIWCFIDMVMILLGKFKDKNGVAMPNISPKLTWAIFVVCVIIGIASTGGEKESTSGGSGSGVKSSKPSSERRLAGIYQCATPMWTLQLKSDGSYLMEALDTGDRFKGTWSVDGTDGTLDSTTAASMSFTVQSDGAIVIDKYGYTFVRTQ